MKIKIILWILVMFCLVNIVAALPDGTVGCWDFDSDSLSKTGGNHLTIENIRADIVGSYAGGAAKVGNGSLYFDAASASAKAENTSAVNMSKVFTMNFWFDAGAAGDDMPFSVGDGGSDYMRCFGGYGGAWTLVNGVNGAASSWAETEAWVTNEWHMITVVFGDNGEAQIWEDAILQENGTADSAEIDTDWTTLTFGNWQGGSHESYSMADGSIDNVIFLDTRASSTLINEWYNASNGRDYCNDLAGAPPGEPVGEVTVGLDFPPTNHYNTSSTINFSINVNSTNSSLASCSIVIDHSVEATNNTPLNITTTKFFNVAVAEGTHFYMATCVDADGNQGNSTNRTLIIDYTAPTQTNNFIPYYTHNQTVNINITDNILIQNLSIIDTCNISYINLSIDRAFYNYTYSYFVSNCSLGSYSTNVTYCDYAGNCGGDLYTWENMGQVNLSVLYAVDNSSVSNFTIYIDDVWQGNTTSGSFFITNLTGSFNISVDAPGYALGSVIFTVTETLDAYNITIYGSNSLNIILIDEILDTPIYEDVSITFTSEIGVSWTNVTNSSSLYIEDLNATEYTLQFYNDNYALRTYIVTVGDRTTQTLTAYMINNTYSTIFTVKDIDTSAALPDVSFGIYIQTTGEWVLVSNPLSDITGRVKFYYNPIESYRFYLSKDNYDDLIFYLNPIIFDSYNIHMTQSNLLNYSFNLDDIAIVYGPQSFNNSQDTNFTFLINSPYGSLTEYGINLTYPGGSNYITGNNAIGGALNVLVNISNATVFDTVELNYFYITTIAGRRNFTDSFPITFPDGIGTNTFMTNKDRTYGLGIFERVLVATLIAIFIVGMGALVGQLLAGFALNLLIQSYLTYIGFIPIWITLPSLFLGIMLIIWKSGGT